VASVPFTGRRYPYPGTATSPRACNAPPARGSILLNLCRVVPQGKLSEFAQERMWPPKNGSPQLPRHPELGDYTYAFALRRWYSAQRFFWAAAMRLRAAELI
jgi:hypothetical protein